MKLAPLIPRVLVGFLTGLLFSSLLVAQDHDPPRRQHLRKTTSFADEAVGVQTKGQLQNLLMNYGQITDTRYEDVGNAPTATFFDFRYPREHFTGLCDDFGLFFAIKENSKNNNQGNVIDAWTDNDNEDWVAKDGSYGKTHYNPAVDPTPHAELLYNNQTPYLAHSDLPDTWPVDATGQAFWPGLFRRDPGTGVQIPGEFASDRDIYCEFTDDHNQLGDVVGIEVHLMSYCYGRVYAEDILFYELFIINKSGRLLQGCSAGFYQDPDCSDYGQETLLVVDSTFADGSKLFSIAQRDFDGDIGGATVPNSLGITEDYTFGTVFLETPRNMGITDFHYFLDSGPGDDRFLWPIITSDPTNVNIAADAANYFHGSNTHIDDVAQITTPQDLVWIAATGPFDMAAGDTVKLTFAVIAGDDDADYYQNLWQAKQMFDAHFNGPAAPPSPTLSSVTGDRRVTLFWDDAPESASDPSTGDQDFEGYKIYRSEDGGVTWGTKITDAQGRTFGYVPVAQFDLNDNIKGPDPKNPLMYLGNDTGLRHSWVDSSVVNGIAYSYTIVSYDQGTPTLYALEGARGDGPQVKNFVTVTPTPRASGFEPTELKSVAHTAGSGTGAVKVEIIDDGRTRSFPYRVTLEGTPATRFSLARVEGSTPITILQSALVNRTDLPIVDGFRVAVETDALIGGLKSITDETGKDVQGVSHPSSDSSWYVSATLFASADTASRSASYEIRFETTTTVAYSWGLSGSVAQYNVPFSVWNKVTGEQLCCEVRDLNNNGQWDEGETIFLTRAPYPSPAPSMGSPNPASTAQQFAYQVSINNFPGDAADTPPTAGTIISVNSYNALRTGDQFEFEFTAPAFNAAEVDLNQIRVVPNPYIVASKFEAVQNIRQIRFMYLPPECTISIYTVAGTLVKTLHHTSGEGSLSWNLLSDWNQALAFGIYVYIVETPQGKTHIGKFALIK